MLSFISSLIASIIGLFLDKKKSVAVELGEKTQEAKTQAEVIAEQKEEIQAAEQPVSEQQVLDLLDKGKV